ncbi:MAG: LysM domain-containing protein [Anaerolineae bacterium]
MLIRAGEYIRLIFICLLLFVFIGAAPVQPTLALETYTAQLPGNQSCAPDLLQALNQVDSNCAAMGRNQACYGNDLVNVQYRPDVTPGSVLFNRSGDIANLISFERIQTTPFNPISNTWGIALLKAQVDIPDALPGQNVTFLLFGDTSVSTGTTTMRAFTVETRIGTVVCNELPESSLLIQAPENQRVRMNINGADVILGSTARIVSHANDDMIISLLEGSGEVQAYGVQRLLVPGSEVWMPLGGEGGTTVDNAPSEVRGYDLEAMQLLPLELLDRPITLVPPIDAGGSMADMSTPTGACTPRTDWTFVYVIQPGDSLSGIASRARVSLDDLTRGNCVSISRIIRPGETLRTPIFVSPPPRITNTPTTPTPTVTATPVEVRAFIRAVPQEIVDGDCIDLTWGVTGGQGEVSYSNLNGLPVPLNGTMMDCPKVPTDYVFIMAYTDGRSSTATVHVEVISPVSSPSY